MNSSDSDPGNEEVPKRERLNQRQVQSELYFHSFQSVWSKSRYRHTQADPDGGVPDPVPMPLPGRTNIDCLYNADDITIKYHIEKDVMVPDAQRVIDGVIHRIRCPRHVSWKWLEYYAHNVMSNVLFRYFTCPYGCFEIQNHKILKVYFPNRFRSKFAADFSCTMKYRGNWNDIVKLEDPTLLENINARFDAEEGRLPYQFKFFKRGIPLGMHDIKFTNILDTYRYCFTFDYVLDSKDRKHALDGREFRSANEMWCYCMENLFRAWREVFAEQTGDITITRYNKERRFKLASDYDLKYNYINYKDIPKKAYMDTFQFKRGHFRDPHPNNNVIAF